MMSHRHLVLSLLLFTPVLLTPGPVQAATVPVDQQVAETVRALSVKTRLLQGLGSDALRISVEVSGKSAVLMGAVSRPSSIEQANQIALSVDGVAHVDNRLTADPGPSPIKAGEAAVRNALLDAKVESVLIAQVGVNALSIHVESVGGTVTLSGRVADPDLVRAALHHVRGTPGVKKVVNQMQ